MSSRRAATLESSSTCETDHTSPENDPFPSLRELIPAAATMKVVGEFTNDFEALCYVTLAARGGYLLQTEFESILKAKQSNVSRTLGILEEKGYLRRNTEFNPSVVIMEQETRPQRLFELWQRELAKAEQQIRTFFADLVKLARNDYQTLARLLQQQVDLEELLRRRLFTLVSERGAKALLELLKAGGMAKKDEVIIEQSSYPEYHQALQLEFEQFGLVSSIRHLNDVHLVILVPMDQLFTVLLDRRFPLTRASSLQHIRNVVGELEQALSVQHHYLQRYGRITLTNKSDVRRRLKPAFRRYARVWMHLGVVDGVHDAYDADEVAFLGELLDIIATSTQPHTQLVVYFSPPAEPITTLITTAWKPLFDKMRGTIRLYMINDPEIYLAEHFMLLERHAVLTLQRSTFKGTYDIRPLAIQYAHAHFERITSEEEGVPTTLLWETVL